MALSYNGYSNRPMVLIQSDLMFVRLLGTARLFASQFTGGALCGDVHQNLKLNLVDGSHRSLPVSLICASCLSLFFHF